MKYLENARWAVMDRIGFGLDAMIASGFLWPVVGLTVKYIRAARCALRRRASGAGIAGGMGSAADVELSAARREGRVPRRARAE
jgi:hypothetical protein